MNRLLSELRIEKRQFIAAVLIMCIFGLDLAPTLAFVSDGSHAGIVKALMLKVFIFVFLGFLFIRMWRCARVAHSNVLTPLVCVALGVYALQTVIFVGLIGNKSVAFGRVPAKGFFDPAKYRQTRQAR